MRFALLLIICLGSLGLQAQTETDSIYVAVDTKPIFPGCETTTDAAERNTCSMGSLFSWVFRGLQYPRSAREAGITGTVVVSFVVNKDGSVVDAKIMKTPDPSLGREGLRLIEQMKDEITWTPAVHNDQTVRYKYVLPIKFKLGSTNTQDMYLVFKAWGGVEVYRGMVSGDIHEKIPGKFIKNIETLDFEKSKAVYSVVGNAHIVNFKRSRLARPQELMSRKPMDISDFGLAQLKVRYSPSKEQLNISASKVHRTTTFYIHNYIGDVIQKGKLKRSNGSLEKVDISKAPNEVLFVSFVQEDDFATVLVAKQ